MDLRAILVCVDYADLLAVALPYNRHHFGEVMVVTTPEDKATRLVCNAHGARIFATNAFYRDGAIFRKWLALEDGLDAFGRRGLLCIMDADILWPKEIPPLFLQVGQLCTPLRRMFVDTSQPIPPEEGWKKYPIHANVNEWAGYSQIFHAEDRHLGPPPWHETDWTHAGGADSFFQRKWPREAKVRPPWEVLHLGPAGENWCGRATPFLDGTLPEGGKGRRDQLQAILGQRRWGDDFRREKIGEGE